MASACGSPAHAGIDLREMRGLRGPHGFPRTRGDRPQFGDAIKGLYVVPPHTRG